MSRLQGKHALITGGTGGIGLETARQFISEGATVAITGRSPERLEAAKQELGAGALTILSPAGDVSNQQLLPLFSNPASIILCGSVAAHIGMPQSSVYAASKAGLLSLTRTLSSELKHRGIRVNGLSPGPTETAAFDRLGLDPQAQAAMLAKICKQVPIGRMGTPWELAKAAVFLASDESRFVVGAELRVDGGVSNL